VYGADIAKIRDAWLKKYAPASVTIRLALLSHLFNTARKEWGMAGLLNPMDDIKKPKVNNARTRRVSDDEFNRICQATESTILPNVMSLALETAARREELTKLTWKNIKLQDRTARLLDTKNGVREDGSLIASRRCRAHRYAPQSPLAKSLKSLRTPSRARSPAP